MNENKKTYLFLVLIVIMSVVAVAYTSGSVDNTDINNTEYYQDITTTYNESSSQEGYNLLSERLDREVFLITNDGDIRHSWDVKEPYDLRRHNYPLILPHGDLIYTNYKNNIARYDNESNIVWKNENLGHHDAGYYNDTIITFHRENIQSNKIGRLVQDDVIKQLDPETGEVVGDNVSIYNAIEKNEDMNITELYNKNLLQGREVVNGTIKTGQYRASNDSIKLFHANSISVLRDDYGGEFKKGNILVSLRNIDTVVLLDWDKKEVVWHSTVDLDRQHHPTMTSDGNILIFDNGWETRRYSRAVEITKNNEIVWEYKNKAEFYSQYMGSAQQLPNDNRLITSSSQDRAFEVNKNGEVVWELDVDDSDIDRPHGGIFRLTRFDKDCLDNVFEGEVKHSRMCN